MSDRRPGLDYNDAAKRVKRIATAPGNPQAKENLMGSIINQATVREGKRAQDSLIEMAQKSLSLSGCGCKQTGIGSGKTLGAGKWRYMQGKWERLD